MRKSLLNWFRFLLLVFAFLFGGSSTRAWGCKGHQIIALIAEKQLTPEARQFAEKLLSEYPVDPQLKRFCEDSTHDLFVDASTWADDVRSERKNGQWHYIDIPRGAPRGSTSAFCGTHGCVTKAIAEQLAILEDRQAAPGKRADALRYVIHFVGDLHMPLHASTDNDEGGNCDPVRYFRKRPREQRGSYSPNLHWAWDVAILEGDMAGAELGPYADSLNHQFSVDFKRWQSQGIQIDAWVWESHDLAETVAYGLLNAHVPVEPPVEVHSCSDADNVGERRWQLHLSIQNRYQKAAAPVVEKQLAVAGARLAIVLNKAANASSVGD